MLVIKGIINAASGSIRAGKKRYPSCHPVVMLAVLFALLPADTFAQPKPTWVPAQTINSGDGYGTLRWTVEGDKPVALFRISEEFAGKQSISFTDQAELRIFRINTGKYTFKVQACERSSDGFPKCGKSSAGLSFNVSAKLDQTSTQKPDLKVDTAQASSVLNIPGGPDQLRPGLWYNPARPGHGWSFYWANRLALPESHAQHGYEYDLVGTWYTYEAKLRYRDGPPPCGEGTDGVNCFWSYENYVPLAVNLKLVRTATNAYTGGVYITRSGVEYLQGAVTLTFGSANTSATVSWNSTFKWQSLAGTDDISPLAAAAPGTTNASLYGGIWALPGNSSIRIADDIGSTTEAVEITFPDAVGDPGWLQAVSNTVPSAAETSLCFYYVQGGYAPNGTGTLQFHQSGCNPEAPASPTNRNGLRYFTGFEQGRFWISYELGASGSGGSARVGTASSPALVEKRANFHRIFWNSADGTSCQLTAESPSCNLSMTWFTDGDFPQASAFRINQSTGQRELLAVSSGPATTAYPVSLNQVGNHVFELRMTNSASSGLLATSAVYSVTSASIATPGNLNVAWANEALHQLRVAWSHPSPSSIGQYQLEEFRPSGAGSVIHAVAPGTVLQKVFDYAGGPFGTYSYRIRACSGTASNTQCSGWTAPVSWQLAAAQTVAHPWSDHVQGTLVTNASFQYAMGYHFRPEISGAITQLGGMFSGVKSIKLFERSTGNLLAQTTLGSNNSWSYAPIAPVTVLAGAEYTVAVYLAGTGGTYYRNVALPVTQDGIRILGTTYVSTASSPDARPTNLLTTTMYGQVDIGFIPGTAPPPPNVPPEFTSQPGAQSNREGDAVNLQIQASDADGDKLTYVHNGTLPSGLSLSATGLIQGTLASGTSANSPYPVIITVTDGMPGHSISSSFTWTVLAVTAGANPEIPPAPAPMPSLAIDAASSRVGATQGIFRVSETGGAHYSVPILTAPGSGGMVPKVSIDWSSQTGNGPLGVGGALAGVSAITRCGQTLEQDGKGFKGGISLTRSDRFCLDGQRLISISGEYGLDGTEYRTEIESFTRVISLGVAGNGPASFKAWLKDGSVLEFGATSDARIEARTRSDTQTVLTWAQNRLTDQADNYVDFVYIESFGAAGEPVESLLQSIHYTGNAGAGTSPFAQMDFHYSSSRADAGSSFSAGASTRQSRLLQRVDSRSRVTAGGNLIPLRSYHLSYGSDGVGRATLLSITECNDAAKSYCFPPTQFGWQKSRHEVGIQSITVGSVFNSQHRALVMADTTGDGRPDLLLTERSGSAWRFRIAPALATGGFSTPGSTTYTIPNNGTTDAPAGLHVIDLNADGFQDVIYPTSSGWKGRVSTGTGLGAEITVGASCCGLSNPPLVRIMDFDGDGLSDLVTSRSTPANQQEIVFLRNRFSALRSAEVGFDSPRLLTVSINSNLFPEQASGGWVLDTEAPHFTESASPSAPFSRPFDYNGDGAVDLLVKLSRRYVQCGANCSPNLSSPAGSDYTQLGKFQISGGSASQDSQQATGASYAWASFYLVLTSEGGTTFVEHELAATGIDCTIKEACSPYDGLPRIRRAQPIDINADGLADIAWMDGLYDWRAQLNTGAGFQPNAIPIADFIDAGQSHHARLQDLNGDGYPEFFYPSQLGKDTAVWAVHENRFGSSFGAAVVTDDVMGNTAHNDASAFVDVNGDGMLDNLFIDIGELGTVQASSTKVFLGLNTASGQSAQAVNLLSSITDGIGANISIQYLPLTSNVVHTRMRNSKNALWGMGSAVYDVVAPIHVVSQVQSSAPVYGNPQAKGRVEYHYVGAKVQGGGRGFLGFAEVIAWDAQSGIRTNSRYRQDFPFVGQLADMTRALASSSRKFDAASSSTGATPVNWPAVSAATTAPSVGGGPIISYLVNQWALVATASPARVSFPYIQNALERQYTLQGNFDRKTLSSSTRDLYGNATQEVIRTFGADDSSPVATRTVNRTFGVDQAAWRLDELIFSSTTHSRPGVADIRRETSFAYDVNSGLLTREIAEPNGTSLKVTTDHKLDSFGNRMSTTVTGNGMAPRVMSQSFDPLGRFVIESRNALNQVTRKVISWDAHGNPTVVDDIDGVRQVSAADHMGRVFISASAMGTRIKTIFRTGAGAACPSGDTAFYSHTTAGGKPDVYRCMDLLGREIRTATQGFDGRLINTDRYLDELGRLERLSEPYFAGEARYWNLTAYDAMGRVDSMLAADGNDQTIDYAEAAVGCGTSGPRRTLTTNGLGQNQLELRNALGETTQAFDHECGATSYGYDAIGNLVNVTGPDGATTTMAYDLAGRKTSLDDPDKGYWQYAHNALGELTRQVDGKSQATDFTYDALGRIVERRELNGVSSLTDSSFTTVNRETTTFNNSTSATVRGKGQILKSVYRSGESEAIIQQKDYSYDAFGRVSLISNTVEGMQLAEETTYDEFGRIFQQFDATGDDRGIRYHYNPRGYPEKLQEAREGSAGKVYQQVRAQDARGNPTFLMLGNGVETFASFDAESGRLGVLEAYDVQGAEVQFIRYGFDVLGNLTSRHDTSAANDLRENFDYDSLNRLEDVLLSTNGGTAQNTLSLQYDGSGNIIHKSDVGSYLYGQNGAGPHAVTKAGTVAYTYDANGNQVSASNGRSITYSVFDKARRVQNSSGFTEFGYGIGNQMLKRTDGNPVDGNRTTWYFGSAERIQPASGNAWFKRYLGAVAVADFYPSNGSQTVQYLVKDHLGSIHTVVPQSGVFTGSISMSFSPFGERRNASWSGALGGSASATANSVTNSGFTGHAHSDALNVIHMGGRIYDPKLGRFLQADPLVQAPKNSQSLNRYSYGFNNPLSYTDPSGYFSLSRFIKKWGRIIVAAVASYFTYGAASGWASSWLAGSALAGNAIATGAIAGGIAGFVGGAILSGNLNGAVRGAFAGALFGGVAGHFGDQYSVTRVAAEGIAGGAGSMILGGDFEDGLVFALAVSGLSYANFKMRSAERMLSEQHPERFNTNGESAGFHGDRTKMAGAREQLDAQGKRLPCRSLFGGCQGRPKNTFDQRSNFLGRPYQSGGVEDFISESFAGPHDWFRNHISKSYIVTPSGPFDVMGNMKNLSGARLQIDRIANAALVPVSAPFAFAGMLTVEVALHTTAFQELFGE